MGNEGVFTHAHYPPERVQMGRFEPVGGKYPGVLKYYSEGTGKVSFYIRFKDAAGTVQKKRVDAKTAKDANAILEETKAAIRNGMPPPFQVQRRTKDSKSVLDIIDYHMAQRERKGRGANVKKDRLQLQKHFAPLLKIDANRLTRDHIEAQLDQMAEAGYNPKTINNALKILRAVYTRAVRDGMTKQNPCEHIEDFKERLYERKRLKVDEVDSLLQSAKDCGDRRLYLFLLIMARTGARPEAVLRLQGKDLNFADRLIKFPALKDGLPIVAPMLQQVHNELLALNLEPEHYVIHKTRSGGKMQPDPYSKGDYESLRRQAMRLFDEHFGAADHRVTLYTLRHSAATQLLRHGVDVAHVSRLLGHKNIQTTMIYVESDGETLREVIEKAGVWGS